MCGRYFVDAALLDEARLRVFFEQLQARLQREPRQQPIVFPSEVRPADAAFAIATSRAGDARGFAFEWGLPRATGSGLIINARSETAQASALFAQSTRIRRCLLPASWYYEWGPASSKRKYAFRPASGEPCLLGGLYLPPAGTGEGLARFVVLTRDAAAGVAHIHGRMPVIIPGRHIEEWLSHDVTWAEALRLSDDAVEFTPDGFAA